MVEYATHLLQQASDHASQRGGKIQPEDLLFLVRKVQALGHVGTPYAFVIPEALSL